jgi:phosphohistidine phosphatase
MGVDLYLIRHGDAVPLGEQGIDQDVERPLTEEGEAQARAVAAGLQKRGVSLGLVFTSPLRRARQTAEGMLRQWSSHVPDLVVCEELAPGGRRKPLARLLRNCGQGQVALVGHQPDLSDHAAWLIGSKKAQLDLAKGGVAYLTFDDGPRKGGGTLVWLVTPEWLSTG